VCVCVCMCMCVCGKLVARSQMNLDAAYPRANGGAQAEEVKLNMRLSDEEQEERLKELNVQNRHKNVADSCFKNAKESLKRCVCVCVCVCVWCFLLLTCHLNRWSLLSLTRAQPGEARRCFLQR
jgi:hypothetical protein